MNDYETKGMFDPDFLRDEVLQDEVLQDESLRDEVLQDESLRALISHDKVLRDVNHYRAHRLTTKVCREHFATKYPKIFADNRLLVLFDFVTYGSFIDRDTKQVVITQRTLAGLEGKDDEIDAKRYRAIDYLKDYKAVMPGFAWTEHAPGEPRRVANNGLDEEDASILEQDVQDRVSGAKLVYVLTGEPFTKERRAQHRREVEEAYQATKTGMKIHEDQRKVIDYLDSIDPATFTRLFNANIKKTLEKAESLTYASTYAKSIQERILCNILDYPKPQYQATNEGRTMRVHPANESFLTLKRELRKTIAKGCISADLRSSQLAILATQLCAKQTQAFIKSGKSIWLELNQFIKGTSDIDERDKACMKEAIYSLAFGKSVNGTLDRQGNWHDGIKQDLAKRDLTKFLDHPIVNELLQQRKKWFDQIKVKGGWNDAYGVWQQVDETRPVRAVGASVIQSIEFKIVNHVFDVAKEHGEKKQFKIISWQHDGFLLIANDKRKVDCIKSLLQSEVTARASSHNVTTLLEFEEI